ncbi:hypothetical protein HDU98_009194 [Podochytrium sp. JEL0797]|nr:hypothetical protein HDU98_009194 [Podochytrium sp. JEL0797]
MLLFRPPVNHLVANKTGESLVQDSHPSNATLHFKNLANCEISVDAPATKIFIEGCNNSTFRFTSRITTQILEVFKSNDVVIAVATQIRTLQADDSNKVAVTFDRKDLFETLVWTRCEEISVQFKEDEQADKFSIGFTEAKQLHASEFEITETDQFIVRLDAKQVLVNEVIVRIAGGFATTVREDDEHVARAKRDAATLG